MAMAIHSPGAVECPVAIVMLAICGLQHRLLISDDAVYAKTGSVMVRGFFELDEEEGEAALRGELGPRDPGAPEAGLWAWARSHRSN